MKVRLWKAAGLLLVTSGAWAQTSVTMYGRIDGGIEYLNHIANGTGGSASRWSAEGGDWGTSMWGLKGNEDLGAGLSAVFDLETAIQIMNGTTGGGRLWSRKGSMRPAISRARSIRARPASSAAPKASC